MRLLLLTGLLAAPSAFAADHVVAVLPFAVHTDDDAAAPLGDGVADMLTTDLLRGDGMRLVERSRLDDVLGELDLQRSEFVDPATARSLGNGLGATSLVVGAVTVSDGRMRIDARVLDVATGESVFAEQVEGDAQAFFALERGLARELLVGLDAPIDAADEAYFAYEGHGTPKAATVPAPTGPEVGLEFGKKGLMPAWVAIDGVPVGKLTKKEPLAPRVVEGKHEVWVSGDEAGVFTRCSGVVEAPTEVLVRDRGCEGIEPGSVPWGTFSRGATVEIRGTASDLGWVTVDGDNSWSVPWKGLDLNLEPGTHAISFAGSGDPPIWSCAGTVTLGAAEARRIAIDEGSCAGFDGAAAITGIPGTKPPTQR